MNSCIESNTPWAPDLYEDATDFDLDSFIKASLDRQFALTLTKPTCLASAKSQKPKSTELHYNVPAVYNENICLLKEARNIQNHISHIQFKLCSELSPKSTDLDLPSPPRFQFPRSLENIHFTQSYPRLDEKSIYLLTKKAVSLSVLHSGFTHSKSSALDTLVDLTNTFFIKFCKVLKSNCLLTTESEVLGGCVDPLEQTLVETGCDGYEGIHTFWQESVVEYRQKLESAGVKLEQMRDTLLQKGQESPETLKSLPDPIGSEVGDTLIEVSAHGSLLEDFQGSNESINSVEAKPNPPSKRIRLN